MKQSRFYILFFFVVCIGLFCSCLSNDDDAQWSKFNGVYVTVGGDNIRGYKLYTDFGAILVPTEESLNRIPWLKEVQRAIVSFNLLDENENTTQLEDGKTYDVILNSTNGMNQQIPTFTVHVDTLSEEYQIFGQDSIQLKNKSIYSLDKTAGAFYIKNGYMNIVPTFEYDLYKPVFFLLYYVFSTNTMKKQKDCRKLDSHSFYLSKSASNIPSGVRMVKIPRLNSSS